jgi:hypothetical protein
MKTSVQSLKDLYVKLGGVLTDTYSDIADGIAVGNYVTIPDAISAVTKKAEAGGGGGGEESVYRTEITIDPESDDFVLDDTLANVYEQAQSKTVVATIEADGTTVEFLLTAVTAEETSYYLTFTSTAIFGGDLGVIGVQFANSLVGTRLSISGLVGSGDNTGDILTWDVGDEDWVATSFPTAAGNVGKVIGISSNGFEAVTHYKPFIATITHDGAVYSCDKTASEIERPLVTGVVLAIVDGSYYLTTCVRGIGDVSFTGIVPNGAALEAWTVTVSSSSVTVDKKTITTS